MNEPCLGIFTESNLFLSLALLFPSAMSPSSDTSGRFCCNKQDGKALNETLRSWKLGNFIHRVP